MANAFPKELAKKVAERWENIVGGDYTTPPIPPIKLLRQFFEIAYLAAATPEESRYPKFNLLAVPADDAKERHLGKIWRFNSPRRFSVDEVRRLAPSVDFNKSAILAEWNEDAWQIAGLVDLGTSWTRARMGLQYNYEHPESLFVQVDRPGRIRAYQGQYLVTELVDGKLERLKGFQFHLALHEPVHGGLDEVLRDRIAPPKMEEPRDYHNFEFTALWNVFAAIANCISDEAHGGAVILVPPHSTALGEEFRIKYPQNSTILQESFIKFMNIRNQVVDFVIQIEDGDASDSIKSGYAQGELELSKAHSDLVEAIRFVARLSGCDGAIILSQDLRLLGFGAEIRAELKAATKIREVTDEMRNLSRPMDIEQFGLRHRSTVKLISSHDTFSALVISQDGPISVIWSKAGIAEYALGISPSALLVGAIPLSTTTISPHSSAIAETPGIANVVARARTKTVSTFQPLRQKIVFPIRSS